MDLERQKSGLERTHMARKQDRSHIASKRTGVSGKSQEINRVKTPADGGAGGEEAAPDNGQQ